jgi:hypothetical protein
MPEEQVRRGGRYVAAKPGEEPQRVEAHIDAKAPAEKLGDPKNHNPAHHAYEAPPEPKPAAKAPIKKEGA